MAYNETYWVDNTPAINKENLKNIEDGIYNQYQTNVAIAGQVKTCNDDINKANTDRSDAASLTSSVGPVVTSANGYSADATGFSKDANTSSNSANSASSSARDIIDKGIYDTKEVEVYDPVTGEWSTITIEEYSSIYDFPDKLIEFCRSTLCKEVYYDEDDMYRICRYSEGILEIRSNFSISEEPEDPGILVGG